MKKILSTNKVFFIAFFLFALAAIVILLQIEKGDVILFFSENRSPFWNSFFIIGTKFGEEIVYVIVGVIFLFIQFRISLLFALNGLIVTIVSYLLKNLFALDRPSWYFHKIGKFDQLNPVEGVHLLTGTSSFPSGHTMSAFAFYTLLCFLLPPKKRYTLLLFSLALMVGISRIYLVQHFLQDVLAGAAFGVLIGTLLYWVHETYPKNQDNLIDSSLALFRKKKNLH